MSNNAARWALLGGVGRSTSSVLWIVAGCLICFSGIAQIETVSRMAQAVAGEAASRDVAYLAVIFSIAAMAFGWWQSRQVYQLAHEANVAAVETARALQRLVDSIEGVPSETQVSQDIADLLKRRRKK